MLIGRDVCPLRNVRPAATMEELWVWSALHFYPLRFWVFHKRGIKEKAWSEEARTETRVGRV